MYLDSFSPLKPLLGLHFSLNSLFSECPTTVDTITLTQLFSSASAASDKSTYPKNIIIIVKDVKLCGVEGSVHSKNTLFFI